MPAWIVLAVAFAAGCRALAKREASRWARRRALATGGLPLGTGPEPAGLERPFRAGRADERRGSFAHRHEGGGRPAAAAHGGRVARRAAVAERKHFPSSRAGGAGFRTTSISAFTGSRWGGYGATIQRCAAWWMSRRGIPALRDRYCSSLRADAPLSASFRASGEALFWDLGPCRGRNIFLCSWATAPPVFEMPRRAGFQMQGRAAPAARSSTNRPPDGLLIRRSSGFRSRRGGGAVGALDRGTQRLHKTDAYLNGFTISGPSIFLPGL